MTYSIPVIDLEAATRADARRDLLAAVRAASQEIGIIQVVNHGVPQDLINDFNQRIGRLLSLPRVKDSVENYLKVFGRPEQIAAWREGRPYVADLAENSAGR